MLHHPSQLPQVCYFYLPSLNGKPAEVIAVLNSSSDTIYIPVPEEDVQLNAFFQRSITPAETRRFGTDSTWRIFTSWCDLETDHNKYGVSLAILDMLLNCRDNKPLKDHLAVA
ncbi:hypothetical protein [Pontibacter populi]|uniref:Uncharacterized protein n=1 Tax=Pontibacter populi TaxID=890055 RepID=A0ABV1RP61_9BACT